VKVGSLREGREVEKEKEGRKMVKIADISHKTAFGMLIRLK